MKDCCPKDVELRRDLVMAIFIVLFMTVAYAILKDAGHQSSSLQLCRQTIAHHNVLYPSDYIDLSECD